MEGIAAGRTPELLGALAELTSRGLLKSSIAVEVSREAYPTKGATLFGAADLDRTLQYHFVPRPWFVIGLATRAGILSEYASFCHRFPRELRAASMIYAPGGAESLHLLSRQRTARTHALTDVGTLVDDGETSPLEARLAGVHKCLGHLLPRYVMLGGDHSVTSLLVPHLGALHVVVLDAHVDLHPIRDAMVPRHDETITRLLHCDNVKSVTVVGARGFYTSEAAVLEQERLRLVSASRLAQAIDSCDPDGRFYLSIDFDVIDPGVVPGVTSPEPFGWSFAEYQAVLRVFGDKVGDRLAAVDFVENSPSTADDLQKSLRVVAETLATLSII